MIVFRVLVRRVGFLVGVLIGAGAALLYLRHQVPLWMPMSPKVVP